jgi:23S rRNA pseudouridine2605 synthase
MSKQVTRNTLKGERINRYMASCGLCSRREADRWIEAGRVSLNGDVILQPGVRIQPHDHVSVDGKPISQVTEKTYMMYYKPKGILCSRRDDKNRPLIYDKLDVAANVQSVGRLDMDSEGLLFLTDDGALAQALTHPSYKIPRKYRVRVTGQISLDTLSQLRKGGIDIGDGDVSDPWEITVDSESKGHSWISTTIYRGRWREVRRTLQAVGHDVRRLIRVRYGNIGLDIDLKPGQWRPLKNKEIQTLKKMVAKPPKRQG